MFCSSSSQGLIVSVSPHQPMSKISSSINKLKKRILSSSSSSENLFSTSTRNSPIFLTRTLISKQSIFSNSCFSNVKIHTLKFNSSHGGARNLSSLRKEHQSSFSEDNHSTQNLKRKDLWTSIPVRAYCLSPRIDLIGLMSENQANLIPHTPGMSNYAVFRFANTNSPLRNLDAKLSGSGYSYIVVFPYGSVVMFNMLDHEVGRYMKIIKRHASGLQPETWKDGGDSLQHYIDYEVREKQDLPMWMQGGLNCMLVQHLNIDGICTVGNVLGQSVALDYYSSLVDQWVKEYLGVNYGLEKRGSLSSWIKLIKHTRRRAPDADAIVHYFGLSERSDIAFEGDTKYAQMLDYLRDEFELTRRFAGLDRKFKMGENNYHFVLMQLAELGTHAGLCVYLILFVLMAFSPVGGLPFSTLETHLMSL